MATARGFSQNPSWMKPGWDNGEYLNELITKLMGTEEHELRALSSGFQYLGFDSKVIQNVFLTLGGTSAIDDCKFLITLFLCRGSNITKIKQSIEASQAAKITALQSKYSLKDKVQRAKDPKTLTLPRIASAFPWVTLKLLSLGVLPRVVSVNMPSFLCCSQFLCFYKNLPSDKSMINEQMKKCVYYYLTREAMVLQRRTDNYRAVFNDNKVYFDAAENTDHGLSGQSAKSFLDNLGITSVYSASEPLAMIKEVSERHDRGLNGGDYLN